MAYLDQHDLAEDKLVIFTSDNGPARTSIHPHGSTGELREKKGHLYEGGIRVPGIIRWPGVIGAGTSSGVPVCGVDILPTLCELAGVEAPTDRVLDGVSLLPLFGGAEVERQRPLYWQFHFAGTAPDVAIRAGDWKLLATLDLPEFRPGADITVEMMTSLKSARPVSWELYHLGDDALEATDVAAAHPEVLSKLQEQLRRMHAEVTAESPVWPEWVWPRYESERIEWPAYRRR